MGSIGSALVALVLGGRLSLSDEKADLNCFRRISALFSGLLNSLPFTLSGKTSTLSFLLALTKDRLVGLVVKVSASRAEGPGFESRLSRDFFGVESYQ